MPQKTSLRRKVLAVLAGGAVLGVGTVATLAAWNDSEFAQTDFTAGSFVFQGSTDGAAFEDHATAEGAAQLAFETGAANLAPGDTVYEAYALSIDGSSYDAALESLAPVDASGTLVADGQLDIASVATSEFGCVEAAFDGGEAVPTTITLDDPVVNLCLQVTATDSLEQGATGSVLWQWNAESVE
ncbi:MAG: SipW-dependent-type signal peptide-containing protein [Microbacterium gubbeenense]